MNPRDLRDLFNTAKSEVQGGNDDGFAYPDVITPCKQDL